MKALKFYLQYGVIGEKCTVCGKKRERKLDTAKPIFGQHDFTACCEPQNQKN